MRFLDQEADMGEDAQDLVLSAFSFHHQGWIDHALSY